LRGLVGALLLIGASLIAALLLFEFVIFRFVLPGSDVPANAMIDGVIRWAPNQDGVFRRKNAVAGRYRINAQGWNSGHAAYAAERGGKSCRVAVVGDSFVEAFQVDHDQSLAENLEREIGSATTEVYRYAVSGAPLSQYVHMIERAALAQGPDVVVVLLIHNDFVESFTPMPGRYTSSFLKLRVAQGRVLGEIAPEQYEPPAADVLRRTATLRFLYYRWGVTPETLRRALFGAGGAVHDANIDVASLDAAWPDIRAATFYLLRRMNAAVSARGAKLLIAMDGVRRDIYAGTAPNPAGAYRLNALAAALAAENGIAFLDLHPVFAADWAANREAFEFGDDDNHWNAHGHAVAAKAVAARLRALGPPCGE